MDKLKTEANGGFPFTLTEFRFEQQAIRDAFTGLLSGLKGSIDTFIISGVEYVASGSGVITVNVSAGYVCFKGEICKVDAHSYVTTNNEVYLNLDVSYSGTSISFKNTTTQNVYEVRKAKYLSVYTNGAGVATNGVLIANVKRLEVLLKEKYDALTPSGDTAWANMNAGMLNQWGVLTSNYPNPAYRKHKGRVYMRGAIAVTASEPYMPTPNEPFYQLPNGFRPPVAKTFAVLAGTRYSSNDMSDLSLSNSFVLINTNGYCYADHAAIGEICLDNISFELE